ncbi:Flagellar rod assembly protein/muramidase FlgJ [Luteimonas sp. 9C]|uniref:flagellar assembly peptidoglycan hydrolase FlgJ n=1 Tax=Luteimonas sp. 9C TaxID=2653148 RepID=UPI0012F43853|nr:flagellar assembly peptidoglycan hydrolase FlgJ [Luteimonas sp. 9C]VXC07335.1 Flagellar rod assembly protein/muramidase FlgJ [Luteimonas sp. 9C]
MRIAAATALPLDAAATPSQPRIREAARELETQFAHMLVKSMRSTTSGDPLGGDNSTYRDMYDQQLAREITKGKGLGLASQIERQLQRSTGEAVDEVPLDTRVPGTITAPALPLAQPAGMTLGLRPAGELSNAGRSALPSAAPGGTLSLASTRSGVSLQALPLPSMTAPPADAAFDAGLALDASSPEAFVQSIWPHAQKAAAELGVPAKALVAQAALETGWGRRLAGEKGVNSNNLFGIKAGNRWSGESVRTGTHEYVDGVRQTEQARFRAYGSPAESFADYTRLIGNDRYAAARGTGDDVHRFATALQRAGYATDPRYAAKLTAIANGPTVTQAIAGLEQRSLPAYDTGLRYAGAMPAPGTRLAALDAGGTDVALLASLGTRHRMPMGPRD